MLGRDWLTDALAQAVGWDRATTEGVAEAICTATTQAEVDSIVQVWGAPLCVLEVEATARPFAAA